MCARRRGGRAARSSTCDWLVVRSPENPAGCGSRLLRQPDASGGEVGVEGCRNGGGAGAIFRLRALLRSSACSSAKSKSQAFDIRAAKLGNTMQGRTRISRSLESQVRCTLITRPNA